MEAEPDRHHEDASDRQCAGRRSQTRELGGPYPRCHGTPPGAPTKPALITADDVSTTRAVREPMMGRLAQCRGCLRPDERGGCQTRQRARCLLWVLDARPHVNMNASIRGVQIRPCPVLTLTACYICLCVRPACPPLQAWIHCTSRQPTQYKRLFLRTPAMRH